MKGGGGLSDLNAAVSSGTLRLACKFKTGQSSSCTWTEKKNCNEKCCLTMILGGHKGKKSCFPPNPHCNLL